jgi:heme oxygenase
VNLHYLTRDLHHACEHHPLGARMVGGANTAQEWADWLWAMRCIHQISDTRLPAHMRRDAALSSDLALLPVANPSPAAIGFALSIHDSNTLGVSYVLHGAHRSGGRVLAPKMAKRGLPSQHIIYSDPDAVQEWLDFAREQPQHVDMARATFAALLEVMNEIEARRD